jgi:DNA end-binding protein Ku
VESLGADFDPSQFHDEYRDAVEEMIDRKRTTGETRPAPVATAPADESDSMTDLLSALQASVDAARSKAGGGDEKSAEKPAAKRSSGGKSRAKKDEADEKPTRKRKPA